MNNQLSDIGVGNLNFHPMPKRFMVWDTETNSFCGSQKNEDSIFDMDELADFMECHRTLGRTQMSRFIFCQSTNLFDEDGKEIFEGGIVRDFDDAIGVVYYDLEDGEYRAKSADGDNFDLAESSCDLKVLGHILSNPELLEEHNA